ncbi:hypothetical protein QAD02_001869 [Eretmocerus hayati]|uniref:Uncharacterized protein n=1 Tax=Eretmocerus hayati TaxID=131215 RepID=A0ACC2NHH4_9HYME|nr:hypothetical protein QAD02_001869 [Eretmocerus hayati]
MCELATEYRRSEKPQYRGSKMFIPIVSLCQKLMSKKKSVQGFQNTNDNDSNNNNVNDEDATGSAPTRSGRLGDPVLSASAYQPEKTLDEFGEQSGLLRRTRLESSKSLDTHEFDIEAEETRYLQASASSTSAAATFVADADEHQRQQESSHDGLSPSSQLLDPIDGNQIEIKPGEYFRNIAPTKSEKQPRSNDDNDDDVEARDSGEGQGAPEGRQQRERLDERWSGPREQRARDSEDLQLWPGPAVRQARRDPSRIYSEHAPPPELSSTRQPVAPGTGQRQANPDIQDIITGIVKLLNGKVNVAVSSAKPIRPVLSTRINNRGPPRISDVNLPLPVDYDTPGMNPPPPPPPDQPATYETPPAPSAPSINQLPPEPPTAPFLNGIPLTDNSVPQINRPWNRPFKPGTRRPITSYKPLSEPEPDKTNSVSTIGHGDSDNRFDEHQHQHQQPHPSPTRKYQSTLRTDNNAISENTLVLGGVAPIAQPIPNAANESGVAPAADNEPKPVVPLKTTTSNDAERRREPTSSIKAGASPLTPEAVGGISSVPSKPVFQTMLNVETSSTVQVIEATPSSSSSPSRTGLPSLHEPSIATNDVPSDSISLIEPSRSPTVPVAAPDHGEPTAALPTAKTTAASTTTTTTTAMPSSTPIRHTNSITFSKGQSSVYSYRPRPGLVLDDTLDYTGSQGLATQRPYGVGPQRHPLPPSRDTFDIVVSAIQGPGGSGTGGVTVPINGPQGDGDILTSPVEGQGFVSIDGKRTYLNLFDNADEATAGPAPAVSTAAAVPNKAHVQPTRTQGAPVLGTGFVGPAEPQGHGAGAVGGLPQRPVGSPVRPPFFHRRPAQPPVRIDTCIVGDSSTCDASQHEACATVHGVSACHCKPGFARITHSAPCKRIVSIVVSIRVDRIYDKGISWKKDLDDRDSEFYQLVAYESNRAIASAMSMTPFSDEYVDSVINNVYEGDVSQGQGGVFVNATLKLAYEPRKTRQTLAGELQKHLLGVIQRRNNNIGDSAVHVNSPAGSISNLQDLDECASSELNDCHAQAVCTNNWGGFVCNCKSGYKDPHKGDATTSGRTCLGCPVSHCNNRGTCSFQGDQMQCSCAGNFYGAQCEIDGEVLGVAIGASVAALIIIILTLVCLITWSRKWSREQKALSPMYGYVPGTLPGTLPARVGSVGTLASVKQGPPTNLPPYMWAQVADHLATANVYATEPMGPTRPSSAMFAYPTLSLHGTIPPVPLPRLQAPPRARQRHQPQPQSQLEPDSSDSEPQDKDRADLIPQSNFQTPRPKSRSSMANQSGIYYDVEYDQGDARHLSKNNIPMSTYSMAPYYRT